MATYFFILGNHSDLSVAEIYACLQDAYGYTWVKPNLLLLSGPKLDGVKLIAKLGGTIKIGEIIKNFKQPSTDALTEFLQTAFQPSDSGKFNFGLSVYPVGNHLAFKDLGLQLKRYWQEQGFSCRLVTSREKVLSSVVVATNKLLDKGAEIVLINADAKLFIGKTIAVQPFVALSQRDYGRPKRDDRSGMLPPKLAQIMLNLAQVETNQIILDPFCGSGTILSEALLLGCRRLIGSDLSAKAIADSSQNLDWLCQRYHLPDNYQLYQADVRQLDKIIKPHTIDAVVSEPYLGPSRGKLPINQLKAALEQLYSQTLASLAKVIKPSGRIVMIWPLFKQGDKLVSLQPRLDQWRIIKPTAVKVLSLHLTARQTLIYGRPNQKIWREIVILKK